MCQDHGLDLQWSPGVDFINIFTRSFYDHSSQSVSQVKSSGQYLYTLLGYTRAKATRKMLLKLTPAINFINILHTNFLHKYDVLAALPNYMYIKKSCQNDVRTKKRACIMLMKLTPGVDFTKLFSPSKKLLAHSVRAKKCRSISQTTKTANFKLKLVHSLPNLFTICQTLIVCANKSFTSCAGEKLGAYFGEINPRSQFYKSKFCFKRLIQYKIIKLHSLR